jgi:hypothetical protein
MTLSIGDAGEVREKLLEHVVSAKTLETGPNSVTEKVVKDRNFIMFSDTDLHCEKVSEIPKEELMELLKEIPQLHKMVVEDVQRRRNNR